MPAPTLLKVPLLATSDPPKLVLPSPKPTWTVLAPRLSWPEPVSKPRVPSFWKFTRPLTVTVVTLVSAVVLAQLNVPPLATLRLVLPSS